MKFHMKGRVISDHLNQAGYVVLGAAVQFASSLYRPLSTIAREWTSNSTHFYAESLEIRRTWCCESNLHSVRKYFRLMHSLLAVPQSVCKVELHRMFKKYSNINSVFLGRM